MEVVDYLYMFFFYAIFGYVWEVIWVSLNEKKLTNRGFVYGPILPIYGFGAVFITLFVDKAISRFSDSLIVIFTSGLVIATFLELVSGATIEKIFKVRYWDYSKRFMNFKGLICLRSSMFFGVMSILMVRHTNIFIYNLQKQIQHSKFAFVIYVLTAVFAADVVVSTRQAYGFRILMQYHDKVDSYLKEIQKELVEKAQQNSTELERSISEIKSAIREKIDNKNIRQSFISNSKKILDDRINRETEIKQKLKKFVEDRIDDLDRLQKIDNKIDSVYNRRIRRINRHHKNIEKIAKRNNITYKR